MKKIILLLLATLLFVAPCFGYITVVDNGTTIVVTCSEDEITFTIATAAATLIENTPERVVVIETYYRWTIYDNRMFRWRYDTGDTTTGMAGNDYSAIEVSGELYWYPLTAAEDTASATITTQLQDATITDPNPGDFVTDLNLPDIISSGFAMDGAYHVDQDASNEALITWDTTRVGPPVVLNKPMFLSGTVGSETDYLVGHFKCDDNAANTTVSNDVSGNSNGTLSGGDNTADATSADSKRGSALLLDGANRIDLSSLISELDSVNDFTVKFDFKANFAYDTASDQGLFTFGQAYGNAFDAFYRKSGDYYRFHVHLGTETNMQNDVFTSNNTLQQWKTLRIVFSLTNDFFGFWLDSELIASFRISDAWGTAPDTFFIGYDDFSTNNYGEFWIDNIIVLDGAILPHGSHFTGNGAVDTDVAHEDITLFWNGSDTTPIGSDITSNGDYTQTAPSGNNCFRNDAAGEYASVATSGNISAAEGSLSFWFKPNAALGADCTLIYGDAAFKLTWDDSDNDLVFLYNTDTVRTTTAFAADDANWHHVRIGWKASTALYIEVDGIRDSLLTGVDAAPTLDATMYMTADDASGTNRANVMMGDLFVTDKMDTPQIWTAFGVPLHIPLLYTGP